MIAPSRLDDFPWPRPAGSLGKPLWDGTGFLVDGEFRRILEFDPGESHWSPELTALHEREAGSQHPIDRASRRVAIDSFRRFVPAEDPIVLDVGCSSGYVLKDIRRALPKASLIGSDYILPPLVNLAREMPNLPILQFDLRNCPLPDNCVDVVTALNVLEHVDQDQQALAHIHRILRPNGIAHVEVPAGPHLYDVYDQHLMHHRRYSLRNVASMAQRAGFEVLRATHLGFFVYPAFSYVKKRNRKAAENNKLDPATRVKANIRQSRNSILMRALTWIELRLSPFITFPIGIRCVLVLRKP
jgi:SAM-dependent methyltransferase